MAATMFDLAGAWQFQPVPGGDTRSPATTEWAGADVPSSIFTCLVATGRIDANDLEQNPENYDWVSESAWRFRKTFDAPVGLRDSDRVELVCDGLDTFATVVLNGKQVGKTANMFVPHRLDVTGKLQPTANELVIEFESPLAWCRWQCERHYDFREFPFTRAHRVYARKAQCQFGWDWGPALPGCGIWRGIRLEGIQRARIAEVDFRTVRCTPQQAELAVGVEIERVQPQVTARARVTLTHGDRTYAGEVTFADSATRQTVTLTIEDPAWWWPAGYGPQNLHELRVDLEAESDVVDTRRRRVGIREVRLDREADAHGPNFCLRVNGQSVYARGANWIPPSPFLGSVREETYLHLLAAARQAQMNILRIWGGGVYESELFYDRCDELGIMVWQDFMFACAYYPEHAAFRRQVAAEATTVVRRLSNHAAVVLYCGNNEIEWMHTEGWLGRGQQRGGRFYGRGLWHDVLPKIVARHAPETPYIVSSPVLAEGRGPGRRHISAHCWQVWSLHEPTRWYLYPNRQVPRFVAEFGMQALPNAAALARIAPGAADPGDYRIEKHNYQIDGNERLYRYMAEHFAPPRDLEETIYQAQVTQARGVARHIEHLRTQHGVNHGVIFWQLNDTWPAVTWAAIDINGEPKALHHRLRRSYAARLLTVRQGFEMQFETQPLPAPQALVAVNDTGAPLSGTVVARLIGLDGRLLDETSVAAEVPAHGMAAVDLPGAWRAPAEPRITALHALLLEGDRVVDEAVCCYLPDKHLLRPEATVTHELHQTGPRTWTLTLTSNVLLREVQLTCTGTAAARTNYFDLVPGRARQVVIDTVEAAERLTVQARSYRWGPVTWEAAGT